MKQRLRNITSWFLLLIILRGVLVSPLYAIPVADHTTNQLTQTSEGNFWQKLLKALINAEESEKEEEKKENKRNSFEEKDASWKTHTFQAVLIQYQKHLCSSHWHDWFYHNYLTIKAHKAQQLYLHYHTLKLPTCFIA